jgi:hypothetical protein
VQKNLVKHPHLERRETDNINICLREVMNVEGPSVTDWLRIVSNGDVRPDKGGRKHL